MKIQTKVLASIFIAALFTGCERQQEKESPVLEESGSPSFDVTANWTGSWKDPKRDTSESFRMELVQTGKTVKGTAIFMDGSQTKADVTGETTGTKIRLVMSPVSGAPYDPLPDTTWIGTVTNGNMSGSWDLQGKPARGFASTGPWSASVVSSPKATSK